MDKLHKSYWFLVIISFVMLISAMALYKGAYENPDLTDQKVSQVLAKFDKLYGQNATSQQKREEVLADFEHEEHSEFYRGLIEHLAEALILAAIMIITVEGFTRTRASKEQLESTNTISNQIREQANLVSENVWNAIFNRLVPEQIATEVKRILKSDVCRIRPTYTVILNNSEYADVPEGYVVVKRQMYYGLLNLTEGDVQYPISIQTNSTTVGDRELTKLDGTKVTLPRIIQVQIDKKSEPLKPDQRTKFTRTTLLKKTSRTKARLCEVYSEVEGLSMTTDRALYILTAPCCGLEVQVINHMPNVLAVQDDDVKLTSGPDSMNLTTPQKWVCEDGLLTGTALSVPWRAVVKPTGDLAKTATA